VFLAEGVAMEFTARVFLKHRILLLLLLAMCEPLLMGQVQTIGKWSTLSYTVPINPIHVALLYNAGEGNLQYSILVRP
jgi:hypothetical protein